MEIAQECGNYKFHFKVIIVDLIDEDYKDAQNNARGRRAPSTVRIYHQAYKHLNRDLRKKGLVPCVVNNLRHSLHFNKASDQVYIIFQMTVIKQNALDL